MVDVIENISHSAAKMCRSTIMHVPHSYPDCHWYIFQQLWQIMQEKISVAVASKPMWQNMRAYQPTTNNPCPHINAGLLLVSTEYSFSDNSQINFSGHMFLWTFFFGMWISCPKFVSTFQLYPT
jgi:hypothetical protein